MDEGDVNVSVTIERENRLTQEYFSHLYLDLLNLLQENFLNALT